MTTIIILPTQLFNLPKSFWKKYKQVIVYEEPHYINESMHPMKLWFHRASMLEYFDSITHTNKKYIRYDQSFKPPESLFDLFHPTDDSMVRKYKKGTMLDSPGFILKMSELKEMDTSSHDQFYKRMRVKMDILMNGSSPIGNKWSYDESNRSRYPKQYAEDNPLQRSLTNKYIRESRSIVDLSSLGISCTDMIWATNRKTAMKDLCEFVKYRLTEFGPYQDAIQQDVIVGYHSCMSAALNIGLLTPMDVISEALLYDVPLQSIEAFVRQVCGWREYIRMKYVLHGLSDWSYLKNMNIRLSKSWYDGTTGIELLDDSIKKVRQYAYASHIERLMLLLNYATLLRLRYDDVRKWFCCMFIDGYDWVMLNVSMGVNSLGRTNRFMKRAYLTNGTYLKKMGMKISTKDMNHLKQLYESFIIDNKALAKKDYRLAAAVKRLT